MRLGLIKFGLFIKVEVVLTDKGLQWREWKVTAVEMMQDLALG